MAKIGFALPVLMFSVIANPADEPNQPTMSPYPVLKLKPRQEEKIFITVHRL
jgi:hypothetical protein